MKKEKNAPWKVLTEEDLKKMRDFCEQEIRRGRLTILDGISDEMRQDWLDESLPMPDRAIRNISISPEYFRELMDLTCKKVAEFVCKKIGTDIYAVYPWRAALAFIPAFHSLDIEEHCHIGMHRNEKKPDEQVIYYPLDDEVFSRRNARSVVIADPMLATGGSMAYTIREVMKNGVPGEDIILAAVICAPEGVFALLREFPNIKIVVAVMDGHLNENAYIVDPGLGDAGDKYMENLDIRAFIEKHRDCFSENAKKALIKRVEG